jgi:hypothetical protein
MSMDTNDADYLRRLKLRLSLIATQVPAGPWVNDLAEMAGDIAQHLGDRAREPQVRNCLACKFSFPNGGGGIECRRNPPVVVAYQGLRSQWPGVAPDWCCGEHATFGDR